MNTFKLNELNKYLPKKYVSNRLFSHRLILYFFKNCMTNNFETKIKLQKMMIPICRMIY
jgi:hypothetical protein